jgi:hypothetical protein
MLKTYTFLNVCPGFRALTLEIKPNAALAVSEIIRPAHDVEAFLFQQHLDLDHSLCAHTRTLNSIRIRKCFEHSNTEFIMHQNPMADSDLALKMVNDIPLKNQPQSVVPILGGNVFSCRN